MKQYWNKLKTDMNFWGGVVIVILTSILSTLILKM